ncbi:MAG: DNA primase family protein [Methermicoccaceae archaeon]
MLLLNDTINAQFFVELYGGDMRWCEPLGRWYVWNKNRWIEDTQGAVSSYAKDTVGWMQNMVRTDDPRLNYTGVSTADEAKRNEWVAKSGNLTRIKAMIELAKSEDGIPVVPSQFDANSWLLNVLDGTVDLRTGELHEHNKDELHTKLAPVKYERGLKCGYDPTAECPVWLKFLDKIFAGDKELIDFIQRAMGYSLTGDVSEEVIFFCHGSGGNGKSKFIGVLQAILGDYAGVIDTALLVKQHHTVHPTSVAALMGKRVVATTEVERGMLSEAMIKRLTSTDTLTARYMRQDYFTFEPTHKLWYSANHKPMVSGQDEGIWRRMLLIPFFVKIADGEKDKHILDKLLSEKKGILKWMVEGCLKWQSEGLNPPKSVLEATEEYRDEFDVLGDFVNDWCAVGDGEMTSANSLYEHYTSWCDLNNIDCMTQKRFGGYLSERGFVRRRNGSDGGRWWWYKIGIGLKSEATMGRDEKVKESDGLNV